MNNTMSTVTTYTDGSISQKHVISYDPGNTETTMRGMVTTHPSGKVDLCGEFNGEGFNLNIDPNTGRVELFV
jgi:hypothetical protein